MKLTIKPRRSGRTNNLIRRAAMEGQTIVCVHKDEATRIFHKARDMGLRVPFPITYNEFTKGEFHPPGISGFLIDNMDMLLLYLAQGVPIDGMTASYENAFMRTEDMIDSGQIVSFGPPVRPVQERQEAVQVSGRLFTQIPPPNS